MSDFDKEKEREKLREKYEQEEERRETTQQMSELLLKGATMLNVHCADCASPIFRHDGKEFCPTCQRPVEELTTAGPGDVSGAAAPSTGGTEADVADTTVESEDVEIEVEGEDQAEADQPPATAADAEEPDLADQAAAREPAEADQQPEAAHTKQERSPAGTAAGQENAEESLAAAIARLADRAAASEDPRQAQELLAAANEAADVLQRVRE